MRQKDDRTQSVGGEEDARARLDARPVDEHLDGAAKVGRTQLHHRR